MEQDRIEDANSALLKLRSGVAPDQVELELREIQDVIAADRLHNRTSWKTIFTRRSWFKRLLLGCGVQAFGPLSGINVINYYGMLS